MSEWVIAHEALSRLARERAALDAAEGPWLLRALRAQAHVHLGFGCFISYVEHMFGYTPHTISEKLRVAEALEQLPASRAALEQGRIGWCAVRELTRVAVSETEEAWLQAARGKTVRQIEQLVAGKRPGEPPSAAPDPRALRYVLRFEVTAETYALFREALLELRRRSSSCFADDAALLEMARVILGGSTLSGSALSGSTLSGPRDEGRSSYQIALSVCPECRSARQPANGQLIPLPPEIVEMAECDAQRLPTVEGNAPGKLPVDAGDHVGRAGAGRESRATQDSRTSRERRADSGAHVGTAGDEHDAAHDSPAGSGAHVGNERAHRGARAKQDIPPALRRAVLRRDERRCRVPGCRNATFLDLHHLHPRARGGRHSADNLVTLCSAHHRALHRGELRSAGDASDFRLIPGLPGDGAPPPPAPAPPRALDVSAKVASGLCQLGFRTADVHAVLAELRQRSELTGAAPQQWLREALRRLHPAPARAR